MKENAIYVVGDRFRKFCVNERVYPLTEFMRILERDSEQLRGVMIRPGQGLSSNSLKMIREAMQLRGIASAAQFEATGLEFLDRKYVHKQRDHNVMITRPERRSENEFCAALLIDERCAEISDHMTGQHIQGMVLTEAARQMFMAVTETYILPDELVGKVAYIFNRIEMEFISFIFPLPIELTYVIHEQRPRRTSCISFVAEVSFRQNGLLGTRSRLEFTTYEAEYIFSVEDEKARETVIASLGGQVGPEVRAS